MNKNHDVLQSARDNQQARKDELSVANNIEQFLNSVKWSVIEEMNKRQTTISNNKFFLEMVWGDSEEGVGSFAGVVLSKYAILDKIQDWIEILGLKHVYIELSAIAENTISARLNTSDIVFPLYVMFINVPDDIMEDVEMFQTDVNRIVKISQADVL